MVVRTLVAQVLAILLLLCTSEGHLNSKPQPSMLTLANGFNDLPYHSTDATTLNATMHEALKVGSAGKTRGKKGSKGLNKKKKDEEGTFDLPLTVFGRPDNVLVTPVHIGTPVEDNMNEPYFVGFDSTATHSWVYAVAENSGGEQVETASPTGRYETSSHSYNPRESKSYQQVKGKDMSNPQTWFEGDLVSDYLELGHKQHIVDNFQFLSARKVHPSSFANRAGSFDGLLGLGLKSEKNMVYSGTSLFHTLARGRKKAPAVKHPAVAFYVSPSGFTGEITFGGHKKVYLAKTAAKKQTKMSYIPVVAPHPTLDWTLECHSLSVSPSKGANPIVENFNVVFMTTVNHAFMTNSKESFKDLAEAFGDRTRVLTEGGAFKDDYQLIVDCAARHQLPPLQLKIKKHVFHFTGKEVFSRPITGNPEYEGQCASFFKLTDFEELGLLPASKDIKWAIGTDFMKKYYVEFTLSKRSDDDDVPAYIGIGLSSGVELEYKGPERIAANGCACPPNVVGVVGPAPDEITFSVEACEQRSSSGEVDSSTQQGDRVPKKKPVTPCPCCCRYNCGHRADSAKDSSSAATKSPTSADSSTPTEEVEDGSGNGCGDGTGSVTSTTSTTGHIEKSGEIKIEGSEQKLTQEKKMTSWKRRVAAGVFCSMGVASSIILGGEILRDQYAAIYFDAGGGMMVGRIDEDNHVHFRGGPPPPDAVRASEKYGGKCKHVMKGDTWKLDCADDDWGERWAFEVFEWTFEKNRKRGHK